jgi:2-iminobutanoate/2-iminopropanoate deaminase|tara:strand:+ start:511 stop:894 length:384 start_codon:yes stop_codon:yes gene_type:complete
VIHTDEGPAALGPYSQATKLPVVPGMSLVFVAGQIALDPATGELIDGSAGEQAHRVMQNVQVILEEAGSSLNQVLKTTIFLTSMDLFAEVNEAYGSYFVDAPPARATVAVAGLPKSVEVEIEVMGYC